MQGSDFVEKHRRYLPHLQLRRQIISLTWRLAFTLPQEIVLLLDELRISMQALYATDDCLQAEKYEVYAAKLARYDDFLGKFELPGLSLCEPTIGEMLCTALRYYDSVMYQLHAYCIMPNHIHLLLKPLVTADGTYTPISVIMQRLKSYTAKQINQHLNREGKVWNNDYFDRYIRNSQDYYRVVEYILNNPVKAGLADRIGDWKFAFYQEGLIEKGE